MKRIAMWSGPRNISTAMMRSFENRDDTVVVDEPFYACYLSRANVVHPGHEEILINQSTDEKSVIRDLTEKNMEGVSVFYQKHMCHHMLGSMDRAWLKLVTNAFLIRDPRAMVASYVKAHEDITYEGLGAAEQEEFFDLIANETGKAPIVIDSADILKNPREMLQKLCTALEIDYSSSMLHWPAGMRDSDGIWAPHWYASVEKSTGFIPYKERTIELDSALEKIADACMPAYEKLSYYKL